VLTFTDYRNISPGSSQVFAPMLDQQNLKVNFLFDNPIHSMSLTVINSASLDRVGGIDSSFPISFDRDLYIRLLDAGNIVHIQKPLVKKYTHSQNTSADLQTWLLDSEKILDKFFLNQNNKRFKHLEKKARAEWFVKIGLQSQDTEFTKECMIKGFELAPEYISKRLGIS
jgi:hypothetical protein